MIITNRRVVSGFIAGLVLANVTSGASAAIVAGTPDISFIVGSGENQSNLVIDFNDGEEVTSFAWGYRYDGVVSGADLLIAIGAVDPNLSLTFGGSGESGFFLSQIDYLENGVTHSEAGTDSAFWAYYIAGGTAGDDLVGTGGEPTPAAGGGSALPDPWTSSPTGASAESFGETGRLLTDGSWDAWSFGTFRLDPFVPPGPPGVPTAAVPEPSTTFCGVLASLLFLRRRR